MMRLSAIATIVLGCLALSCVHPDPIITMATSAPVSLYRSPRAPAESRPWHRDAVRQAQRRPVQRVPTVRTQPRRPSSPPASHPTRVAAWLPQDRRVSSRWTTIVVHHSATKRGDAASFDRFHRKRGWDELGYHFVIGNGTGTSDGLVEVGSRWHKQKHGAHCKTKSNYYNDHGIGICLVGDFTKAQPSTKQLASLNRLIRFLRAECGIPSSRVVTHGEVTHKTACPGRHFPIAGVRRATSGSLSASSL